MAANYISYFDKLPKIDYDINRSLVNSKYQTVTNIFFRVRYLREVMNNIFSYLTVEVTDGDTPEILAEKVYGDSGAAWMIILANQIIDPQWEWPLDNDQFRKYIIDKYGSIENAQTTNHHYEMVIKRTLSPDNITTERRYRVNSNNVIDNILTVPFNYYYPKTSYDPGDPYEEHDLSVLGLQPGSLAVTQYYNTYDINGKTVIEVINGNTITNYDYEAQVNDDKRFIKIVKKDYYTQIMNEMNKITNTTSPYQRRVIQ